MPGPSYDFQRFIDSVNAPRTERRYADEFDLGALARLGDEECRKAESLLLERLVSDRDDDRVAGALAIVGSLKAVIPLRQALGNARGLARLRIAVALARLSPSDDPTEILVEAMSSGDPGARALAAREMAAVSKPRATAPLLAALTDPSFAVRVAAFGALLEVYDLRALKDRSYSPLATIGMRLLSDLPSIVQRAAAEMSRLTAELDAGKTPEELGLDQVPDGLKQDLDPFLRTLRRSSGPAQPSPGFDVDTLRRLHDQAPKAIEAVLLAELHTGNPLVPRALAIMGSADLADVLREALGQVRGSARVQTARALELLTRDGSGKAALEQMLDTDRAEEVTSALDDLLVPSRD